MLLYLIVAYTIHGEIKKSDIINSKYQLPRGMKYLNYLTDQILYQMFQIILCTLSNVYIDVHKFDIGLHLELKQGIIPKL